MRARSLLLVLLAVSLAGCGSDGDSGDPPATEATSAPSVSLAEFIADADRICAEGRRKSLRRLRPLQERLERDGRVTVEDVMKLNAAGAAAVAPMLRELEALPRPAEKAQEVEAYLEANRQTLAASQASVAAYERGNREAVNDALRRNRQLAFAAANAAGAVGFKQCGKEFQAS